MIDDEDPIKNISGIQDFTSDNHNHNIRCVLLGNIHEADMIDHSAEEELWSKEPSRDERLIVKTNRPFNAEIPAKLQVAHFDTPKYVGTSCVFLDCTEIFSSINHISVWI